MRGLAILGGVELIERFHVVIYVLGATLLRARVPDPAKGVDEHIDPDRNAARARRAAIVPVTRATAAGAASAREDGRCVPRRWSCAHRPVAADIAFAVDSIPAAFAITRDALVIWIANAFALLGLRALFVLVEGLDRALPLARPDDRRRPRHRRGQAPDRGPRKDPAPISLADRRCAVRRRIALIMTADRPTLSPAPQADARPRPRRRAAPRRARGARCGQRRARGPPPRARGRRPAREQRLQLGLDVERRLAAAARRSLRAVSIWRISSSRSALAVAPARARGPGSRRRRPSESAAAPDLLVDLPVPARTTISADHDADGRPRRPDEQSRSQ